MRWRRWAICDELLAGDERLDLVSEGGLGEAEYLTAVIYCSLGFPSLGTIQERALKWLHASSSLSASGVYPGSSIATPSG